MAYRLRRGLGSVQSDISAAAAKYGVPPSLALAVAQKESSFNQSAVSPVGAIGVMQLMPATAASLGVNPYDQSQNIDGGVRYLSQMYAQFGDWNTALEAYNAGPGRVASGSIPTSSVSYASDILASAGLDSGSMPVDSGSQSDSFDSGGTSDAGLSTWAVVGLGMAAVAVLFAVAD